MSMLVINDVHIDVTRGAGTTPKSVQALKDYVLTCFEALIMEHTDRPICIAGDLFDRFEVSYLAVLRTYTILARWLRESGQPLYLIRGNHDSNPRGDKVSSFQFLSEVLCNLSDKVKVVGGQLTCLAPDVWAIGHCDNQDLFDLELTKALGTLTGSTLILHCNYDNHFAVDADHSLNLSEEVARSIIGNGNFIISGHEHQKSTRCGGKLVMLGNQWPTSVADCLGNDEKYAHILDGQKLEPVKTWSREYFYTDIEWTDLETLEDKFEFIRVSGTVAPDTQAAVVTAIAKFRSKSDAFVVANATRVSGVNDMDEMGTITFAEVKSFDVKNALLELLTPEERLVIERVLADE